MNCNLEYIKVGTEMLKENEIKNDKIELTFDELMKVFWVLEKMLQSLHRSEMCEDIDVRAYGLALITTEMGLSEEVTLVRRMLSSKLNRQQELIIEDIIGEWKEPILPYGKSYDELKKLLTPYMVSIKPYL